MKNPKVGDKVRIMGPNIFGYPSYGGDMGWIGRIPYDDTIQVFAAEHSAYQTEGTYLGTFARSALRKIVKRSARPIKAATSAGLIFNGFTKEVAELYNSQGGKIKTPTEALAYLMLITTEVAEAAECVRRNQTEACIENGKPEGLPSELADIVLRTMIFAESQGIDLEAAILEKHHYNKTRPSLKDEGKCL